MVAAKLATLQRGRPSDNPPIGGISQPAAAEMLNVGERTVQRARQVQTHGTPVRRRLRQLADADRCHEPR